MLEKIRYIFHLLRAFNSHKKIAPSLTLIIILLSFTFVNNSFAEDPELKFINPMTGQLDLTRSNSGLDTIYLRLDDGNSPTADYNWTTDLTTTGSLNIDADNISLTLGEDADFSLYFDTIGGVLAAPTLTLDIISTLVIGSNAAADYGITFDGATTNGGLAWDESDGKWILSCFGGTNNESVIFDLDSTANTVGVGTNTGVTEWDFGGISIDTNGSGSFGTGITDDSLVIQFGNITWCGNISGTDVDINAGTGNFTTSGTGEFSDVTLTDMVYGTPTYTSLANWSAVTQSAGLISGGVISDATGGNINVTGGTGIAKTANTEISPNVFVDFDARNGIAIANDDKRYTVYVDYDASPQVLVTNNPTADVDHTTKFAIGSVFYDGTHMHVLNEAGTRIYNVARRGHYRARKLRGFERATGLLTGDEGTRHFSITNGVVFAGWNELDITGMNTVAPTSDNYASWYYDADLAGGTWVEDTTNTQLDNVQYNDPETGVGAALLNLTSNRYGVHWIFMDVDNHCNVVYGQGNYTLAQAQNAVVPASLPPLITNFAILVARVIVREGAAEIIEIGVVDGEVFAVATANNHNELAGLQGGTADQYYHLTAAEEGGDWGAKTLTAVAHNISTKLITVTAFTDEGINAAIDALGADGGEVYMPEGTYTIDAVITIDYNNTTLRGAGRGTILDSSGWSTGNSIDINGSDYVTFKDFTMKGAAGTGNATSLVYSSGSSNIWFDEVYFYDADFDGIKIMAAGDKSIITNCEFYNFDKHSNARAIYFETGDHHIVNNNIFETGQEGCAFGNNSHYSIFDGNQVKDYITGFYSRDSDAWICSNNYFHDVYYSVRVSTGFGNVSGNVFNYGSHGVYSTRGGLVVEGNMFLYQDNNQISFAASDDYNIINDNWFFSSIYGNNHSSINLSSSDGNVIEGNHFQGTAGQHERAINLVNSDNNIVQGNWSDTHDACFMELDVNSDNNHVIYNHLEGEAVAKVIDGGSNNTIINSVAGVTTFSQEILAGDKVAFTQVDGNEYIDSLNDGYLDLAATTGIRLTSPATRLTTGDLWVGNNAASNVAIVMDSATGDGQITWNNTTTAFDFNDDVSVPAGNKFMLEGSAGDTYFHYTGGRLELYVDNVLVEAWE